MRIYRSAIAWLRSIDHWRWAFVALPFALFLSILFGIGSYLQYFAYDALQGGPPTVAEAASGEPVSLLPSLGDWCFAFFDWQILLIGSLAAAISLRGSTPRHIALFTGLSLAVFITAYDLFLHLDAGNLTANALVQDFIANVVGAAMVAIFATAAFWVYETIIIRFGSGLGYRSVAAASMLLFAVLLSVIAYYFIYFFYQPALARFEFTARAPYSGYVDPRILDGDIADRGSLSDFSLIPARSLEVDTFLTATDGKIATAWRTLLNEQPFKLKLFAVTDCTDLESARAAVAENAPPLISEESIKRLGIKTDPGLGFLDIAKSADDNFSVKIQRPTYYWVEKEKDGSGLELTYFLVQKNVLTHKTRGATEFLLRAPLQKVEDHKSSPISRTISLKINGRDQQIRFNAERKMDLRRKLQCHAIPNAIAASGQVPATSSAFIPAVYVKIEPVERPLETFQSFDSELLVDGLDGPFETDAIKKDALKGHQFGYTDLISLSGNVTDLTLDGVGVPTKAGDQIFVLGEITGRFGEAGEANFDGTAKVLWRNGSRINKTRWEKLSTEWQLALLASLGSLLLGLYGVLRPTFVRLGSNAPFHLQ